MTLLSKLLLFHQLTNLPINHHNKPPPSPSLPFLSATLHNRRCHSTALNCRTSGGDDFLSTNSFYREFSVIANMLKKIEPLDTSVISNGVSDSVINAMKQMIAAMLGLIPFEELSVTVTVSKRHLVRLLASSVITGYTLWNADYRIRLLRNFEKNSADTSNRMNSGGCDDALEVRIGKNSKACFEELERLKLQCCLDDLSNDAVNYIQKLELELSTATKELHTQKQETMRIVYTRESSNDLLKYLRSLDSDMVNELSRPSSSEVNGGFRSKSSRKLPKWQCYLL
uniref:uncharacterized protein LOC122588455 isoform X2 n=1 Tax=Erigeron canadensis TaxID=72917 RepID=UPI001CB89F98|nr:uncharacterized protein LOC122588455 isoform X2 [Erigeron canadensis]